MVSRESVFFVRLRQPPDMNLKELYFFDNVFILGGKIKIKKIKMLTLVFVLCMSYIMDY